MPKVTVHANRTSRCRARKNVGRVDERPKEMQGMDLTWLRSTLRMNIAIVSTVALATM